jgi:hypothetical protein
MADHVIRLDKMKTYSTNHGEMTPDDPMYRVAYWQGGKMGGKVILLPFDVHGELVPDNGSDEIVAGLDSESKPVKYRPLWSAVMRQYVAAKRARMTSLATKEPDPLGLDDEQPDELDGLEGSADDDVDFVAWLKGNVNYKPHILRSAAAKRFSRKFDKIVPDMIVDLVRDEYVVPEDQLCDQFKAALQHLDEKLKNAA